MRNLLTLSLIAAVTMFASVAGAQEEAKKCEGCTKDKATTVAASATKDGEGCSTCKVTEAMAKLPKMTYRVGTENTCCSEAAAKLVKETKKPMHYVVGEKVFEEKEKAYVSLVEQTEEMVNSFVTPCKCEKSGTHTVAGKSCKCEVQAGKNAELVANAIKDIKMTYVVGEESCNCPVTAGKKAKEAGKDLVYVVAGEKTCCNMTARLNLAKAKYKAAVKAMLATDTKMEAKEKVGT